MHEKFNPSSKGDIFNEHTFCSIEQMYIHLNLHPSMKDEICHVPIPGNRCMKNFILHRRETFFMNIPLVQWSKCVFMKISTLPWIMNYFMHLFLGIDAWKNLSFIEERHFSWTYLLFNWANVYSWKSPPFNEGWTFSCIYSRE